MRRLCSMPKSSKPGVGGPSASGQAEPPYSIHTNMAGTPASKELKARYEFLKSLAAQAHHKLQENQARPPSRPGSTPPTPPTSSSSPKNAMPLHVHGAPSGYPDIQPVQDQVMWNNPAGIQPQAHRLQHMQPGYPQYPPAQAQQQMQAQGQARVPGPPGIQMQRQGQHQVPVQENGRAGSPALPPPYGAQQSEAQSSEPLCIDIKVVTADGQQTGELKCPLGKLRAVPCLEVQSELKSLYGKGSLFLNLKGDKRALCLPSVDLLAGHYTYQLAAPRDRSMSSSTSVISMTTATSSASTQIVQQWLQQQQPPEQGPLARALEGRALEPLARVSLPAENGAAANGLARDAPIVNRFNQLFAQQNRSSVPSRLSQMDHAPASAPTSAQPVKTPAVEPELTASGRFSPAPLPMPGGGWWFHHNKFLPGNDINDDRCMELMQSADMAHVRRMAQYVQDTYGKDAEAFACNGFIKHTFHPDLLQWLTAQEGMSAPVGVWERFQDGMGVPAGWMYMPGFYAIGEPIEEEQQQQQQVGSIAVLAMRAQRLGAAAFATDGRMFRVVRRVYKPSKEVSQKIGIFQGLFLKVGDN